MLSCVREHVLECGRGEQVKRACFKLQSCAEKKRPSGIEIALSLYIYIYIHHTYVYIDEWIIVYDGNKIESNPFIFEENEKFKEYIYIYIYINVIV